MATKTAEATKPETFRVKVREKSTAIAQRSENTAPATPINMLAVIASAASDPRVDVPKMQALLGMQKELEAEQARKAFIAAFIELQRELPEIRTDGKIEIRERESGGQRTGRVQQATPYATFQNIMKTVKPLLREYGFALSFSTEPSPDGTRIIVKGLLEHTGGHFRETHFPLPAEVSGSKNNVQGWGSTFSYGKRYSAIALLNIISNAKEDKDIDGSTPKIDPGKKKGDPLTIEADLNYDGKITTAQHDKLIDTMEACGVNRAKFCEFYGITKAADLPSGLLSTAIKACQDFKAKQEKARG